MKCLGAEVFFAFGAIVAHGRNTRTVVAPSARNCAIAAGASARSELSWMIAICRWLAVATAGTAAAAPRDTAMMAAAWTARRRRRARLNVEKRMVLDNSVR